MNTSLAPVILFIYNRPEHTRKVLEALKENIYADSSLLYVFADGPKENATEKDLKNIAQVCDVIKEKAWCKEVHLILREKNIGLTNNIIDGITQIINRYGKAIILEDDLVTSPYFLKYCNEGLKVYKETKNVFSINGFMFPVNFGVNAETFLCPLATSSWGWATWADRWNQFEAVPEYVHEIEGNKFLKNRFNFGDYDYLNMLKNLNTWDIRWYYTAFIRNGLGVFPTRSLVKNIGFDGSGTHGGNDLIIQEIYPSSIEINNITSIQVIHYLKLLNYLSILSKTQISQNIMGRIKSIFLLKNE